jgi:hypothetical protein
MLLHSLQSLGLPAPGSTALKDTESSEWGGGGPCGPNGLTMQDVAKVWVDAISPLSGEDAAAMCVPAVAIAAGSSYDVKGCAQKFHPTVQSGEVKGLWQVSSACRPPPARALDVDPCCARVDTRVGAPLRDQINEGYDPDPKKQAEAVYSIYTGNNPDYGCISAWCQQTDCSEGHFGIGQDEKIMENHRFCKGVWTADSQHYVVRVGELGGIEAIRAACSSASSAAGAGVVGNGKRVASSPEEAQLGEFLRQQIGSIYTQDATENMVSKLTEAMVSKGISSVRDAAQVIGKGPVSKAAEICGLARVELDGQLLKEWLSDDAAKAMLTMSPQESAAAKAEADEDTQVLTDYLTGKLAEILTGDIPDQMSAKLVGVMQSRGITSLNDAFERIGLGDIKEAQDIVTMSGLDLEPQLFKEFLDPSMRKAHTFAFL